MQAVAARVGGGDRVEVVEHRLRVGAVVQQRGDHHRPAAVGGQRLEERHRRVRRPWSACRRRGRPRPWPSTSAAHLAVVGEARRHRQAAFAVVRGRGAAGEADGAGVHAPRARCACICAISSARGGALRCRVAHHVGADDAVADVGGDVDRAAAALAAVPGIPGRSRSPSAMPCAQHLERHAFDLGQVAHRELAVLRPAGRDGEAAVADHRGGHAERGRGRDRAGPR